MSQVMLRRVLVASLGLALLVGFMTSPSLVGQDAKKPAAKAKGRLPAYFKDVVTESQKQKIYDVQSKYAAQIDALEAQIQTLTSQRDAEIDGLLSEEQLAKVNKLRSEAAAKRKGKAKADAAEDTTSTESETPAATSTAAKTTKSGSKAQ